MSGAHVVGAYLNVMVVAVYRESALEQRIQAIPPHDDACGARPIEISADSAGGSGTIDPDGTFVDLVAQPVDPFSPLDQAIPTQILHRRSVRDDVVVGFETELYATAVEVECQIEG